MEHVAIVDPRYVGPILEGRKTIEARLTRSRREPWGSLRVGHTVYFKRRSGGYAAVAHAAEVVRYRMPLEITVERLREVYGARIGADAEYWSAKADARFAVLVRLTEVRAVEAGPSLVWVKPGDRSAWRVVPAAA